MGILVSIFFLDLPVANYFGQQELGKVYYYSREITNIGYSIHYFIIALMGIVFSKWIYPNVDFFRKKINEEQNREIKKWSFFSVKALLLVGILVNVMKFIVGRKRPHVSENFYPLNFDSFNLDSHWHSLPSGHAQVLFTVATIAILIWPKKKYLFLILAIFLTFTRVTIHQHFLSDIITGATIGYLATLWLHYLWPSKT